MLIKHKYTMQSYFWKKVNEFKFIDIFSFLYTILLYYIIYIINIFSILSINI